MIPSVATYLTPPLPEVASSPPPLKGGEAGAAVHATHQSRAGKAVSTQQQAQDSVIISGAALDLNETLNRRGDRKGTVQQERERQQKEQEQVAAEKGSHQSAAKQYPPFLGDTEVLKVLKQTSPALYREILKMIVPPPADLSYADQQMLAASGNGGMKPQDA